MDANALIKIVQINNRVCLIPSKWVELYKLLPKGASSPLIPAAWYEVANMQKTVRFNQHIEWACSHGVLDLVEVFLLALTDNDWHYRED